METHTFPKPNDGHEGGPALPLRVPSLLSLSLILFCKRHLSQMSKSVTSGDIQPDNNSGSLSPPLPYSEERGLPLTGNVKFSIMT